MRISVVVFPGSNCDHDVEHLYGTLLGGAVSSIWHREDDLRKPDLVVIPGGFAYGDYLRTGALAKLSPAMKSVAAFAKAGGPVLGICNGFQILCEAGLLPGVLLQNTERRFLSRFVTIRACGTPTRFSKALPEGSLINCPIAHGEGNYFASPAELSRIEGEGLVTFRYCSPQGEVDANNREWNPNGSLNSIAGVCNSSRNVVGLMPHPERASEALVGWIGSDSGRRMFAA